MRGAPETYVPGRPSPGEQEPADEGPWPPRIYVPGPAEEQRARSEGLGERLLAAAGDLDPRDEEGCALALFRDPELADEVLGAMERQLRDRDADTVAAVGPGGRIVGAALADRAGAPLAAVRTEADPGEGGETGVAGGPTGEGARALLVATVPGDGGQIRAAARALEAAVGPVVGIVVVADTAGRAGASSSGRSGADDLDDYNLMRMIEL